MSAHGTYVTGLDPDDPRLDRDTTLSVASPSPGQYRTLRVAAADAPSGE
ncbi:MULTISPECIES: hypothetical protein [unclassified Bradyrhizobium]|nr:MULTISPECIES: hypothetical protein [unclassified Bradyrhizobium]